jgi:hypothetical protein
MHTALCWIEMHRSAQTSRSNDQIVHSFNILSSQVFVDTTSLDPSTIMTSPDDGNAPDITGQEGEQQEQEIHQKQEIQEEEDTMYNDHHGGGGGAVPVHERKQKQRAIQRRTGVTAEAAPYDISYRPGRVMLYSPIRQRQKWGDTQVLPRM